MLLLGYLSQGLKVPAQVPHLIRAFHDDGGSLGPTLLVSRLVHRSRDLCQNTKKLLAVLIQRALSLARNVDIPVTGQARSNADERQHDERDGGYPGSTRRSIAIAETE